MKKFLQILLILIFIFIIAIGLLLVFGPKDRLESYAKKIDTSIQEFIKKDNAKSSDVGQKDIFERNPLASMITMDSPIFVIWDSSNEQYKNMFKNNISLFKKKPLNFFSKNWLFEFVEDLANSELVDNVAEDAKGVFFVEEFRNYKYGVEIFPFALYTSLTNKIDNKVFKIKLTEFLDHLNYKYEIIYINGEDVINVKLRDDNENYHIKFLIKEDGLAISNKTQLIERYLNKDYNSGYIKKLLDDNNFSKEYRKSLKENTTCFSLAVLFADERAGLTSDKFDKLIFAQSVDDKSFYINKVVIPYNVSSASTFHFINALGVQNSHTHMFPLGTGLSINIGKALIDCLKYDVYVSGKEYDFLTKYNKLFNSENLNLIVQKPSESNYPGIAIVANNVEDNKGAMDDFKKALSDFDIVKHDDWKKKKINNLESEHYLKTINNARLNTSFDIDVYIVQDGNSLIISNSKNLIIDLTSEVSKKHADRMTKFYRINNQSGFNIFFSPNGVATSLMEFFQGDIMKNVSPDFIKSLAGILVTFNQMPDFVIDVYAIDNTLIYEHKMVLEN